MGSFKIGQVEVSPGERKRVNIRVAALYDFTDVNIPVEVIRGTEDGPVLFISAAIHGDEINGIEIIKRLLRKTILKKLRGTLIACPIINVFGFNNRSRYLPDRRDLNRSFPGNKEGSLASHLAWKFMKEVVSQSTHGIDLHTAAVHRRNLAQIRGSLEDAETARLARAFGVPVIINSTVRDGSLREAARRRKIPILLFEGGEALRYDEAVIHIGLKGCISVMREIGMLPRLPSTYEGLRPSLETFIARDTYWIRAPHSGAFRQRKKIGDTIDSGELLATISDPFGLDRFPVHAAEKGLIIGASTIPLVNRGDAMFHIAKFTSSKRVRRAVALLDDELLL